MSTFPGAFVPVAPPADGLRLAFVAARRRRNTKAGASGAAGLLAAVLLLVSTGGAGDRTLLQEPLPPSSTTGLGVLTGAAPSAMPSAPSAPTSGNDVAAAPGTGVLAPQLAPVTRPESAGGAGEASRGGFGSRSTKAVSGPMSRGYSYGYTSDLICPARKQQEGARGLCTDVTAYASSAGVQSISAEICNVGASTERLSFATARELDISVRQAGLDIWRWSIGRHFDQTPHDATLGVGECLVWSTNWTQIDTHGVPVKSGNYVVAAEFDADQVAGPDRRPTYPITVSSQP